MQDVWPASGFIHLERTQRGWLRPTEAYLRLFLALPELTLVEESCPAESALHAALLEAPSRPVAPAELYAVADPDARSNYAMFLEFRDALLAAGTLESYYLELMRSDRITVPPLFVERIVQAVVRGLLDAGSDAFEARAAELLFRPQRLSISDGRMLSADRDAADLFRDTAGLGDIGRLLLRSKTSAPVARMTVLTADNAASYWLQRDRHAVVLDLSHEFTTELGHGLNLRMTRANSGLKALAAVLAKWVRHFLGVTVAITPLQEIADDGWRWHIGLDVQSMALLNDLYQDRPVDSARLQRLVSLFRLDFANPLEMRADVAGKPVYLGLAMTVDGMLTLKPQNLLLNLPLAAAM